MKRTILLVSLLIAALTLSGCGGQSPSSASPTDAGGVEDQASFITAIQSAGGTAEIVDTVSQPFFTPEGVFVTINDDVDVQVFEYENTQAMENEASQVAPDGGSVGTSAMMWIEPPHFYKSGRVLVLYIGNNTTIIDLLDQVMGPQFAGQ